MNAKITVALKGIRDNLDVIIAELENTKSSPVTTAEPTVEKTSVTTTPEAPKSRKEREASEELPSVDNGLTVEQLNGLSYNSLKRLAKEMGIPATGARDELTQKILNYDGEVPNPDAEDESEAEVAPAKSPSPATKSVGKKTEVAEDASVDGSDDGDDDEEVDELVQKVNEAVEEMTNEEIADILADVGVVAKGKRQALIDAVIKAVREGKIDLDDEDEEEDEEVEETDEVESESEDEEFDVNDPENPDMTKERLTAIEAYSADTREDFKNGNISRADLVAWLNEFHGTKDTMKNKSDKDILDAYIYCSCLLINDEGEMPEEEGAYTVNGVPYCCGHELSYNEDNETYICEVCGGEYEAGEE